MQSFVVTDPHLRHFIDISAFKSFLEIFEEFKILELCVFKFSLGNLNYDELTFMSELLPCDTGGCTAANSYTVT